MASAPESSHIRGHLGAVTELFHKAGLSLVKNPSRKASRKPPWFSYMDRTPDYLIVTFTQHNQWSIWPGILTGFWHCFQCNDLNQAYRYLLTDRQFCERNPVHRVLCLNQCITMVLLSVPDRDLCTGHMMWCFLNDVVPVHPSQSSSLPQSIGSDRWDVESIQKAIGYKTCPTAPSDFVIPPSLPLLSCVHAIHLKARWRRLAVKTLAIIKCIALECMPCHAIYLSVCLSIWQSGDYALLAS